MESTAVAPGRAVRPRTLGSAAPARDEQAPTRSYDGSRNAPPAWALRRVASALSASGRTTGTQVRADAAELAQRTGLSKSLTRRCLQWLRERPVR
ncbi:hypothetical protein [Streptomyces cavernicola]|uniref:HTH iclR-type domain-containing protein n=1 Tax=Streptomyces cavernicola TaxID=3043613 RepID=A0ABT6SE12_9ACTN|nr:hypothetical protein [Streptomyces sp. B-S-A6]MDI3406428.1 hypothetical protein [Streptomyces sp. B-S-A6]